MLINTVVLLVQEYKNFVTQFSYGSKRIKALRQPIATVELQTFLMKVNKAASGHVSSVLRVQTQLSAPEPTMAGDAIILLHFSHSTRSKNKNSQEDF